jgi:hypothetical protein
LLENAAVPLEVDGHKLVAIGCAPSGFVALLDAADWRALCRWKLDRLRVSGGKVRAWGTGRECGFIVDRFLLNASRNEIVFHRNGNPLDLRRSNIVAVSRNLLRQAEVEKARGPNPSGTVYLSDGRTRTRRRPMVPSAVDRVAALMVG